MPAMSSSSTSRGSSRARARARASAAVSNIREVSPRAARAMNARIDEAEAPVSLSLSQVDMIVHVVRCFDDENVIHVSGSVDPLRDVKG